MPATSPCRDRIAATRSVTAFLALVVVALLLAPGAPVPVEAAPAGWTDEQVAALLGRIGYGPRPGDVARVRATGVDEYIAAQLHPERIGADELQARLAAFPSLAMTPLEVACHYPEKAFLEAVERYKAKASPADVARMDAMMPPPDQRGKPQDVLAELGAQKLVRAVSSPRQLEEVMTDFWMNHFNVYWGKGVDRVALTAYERDVIRPRCLGRFRDLLLATAQSPAMLHYLDNWLSTGGDVKGRSRRRGLNENYAREIMELHTLGVDGGYTQQDVIEVARCFTGWTLRPAPEGSGFVFRPKQHDDGAKRVLGRDLAAGRGEQDGVDVIDLLARHPSTARFICTKLCRRFVGDDPPRALVDRSAREFTRTDGDIREVVRVIVTSPELRAELGRRGKVKTPLEFVASAIRALGGETDGGRALQGSLRVMGMPLYECIPPTGFPDRASAWLGAGPLVERMSLATSLASGRVAGTRIPRGGLGIYGVDRDPRGAADRLARAVLGCEASPATRAAMLAALVPPARATPRAAAERRWMRALAVVLASPEFQRR